MRRNWFAYGIAVLVVLVLGPASRRYAAHLPEWLAAYAGDTLWALLLYLGLGLFARSWAPWRLAALTLVIACGVEFSQLYHAIWIDSVRKTQLGGLALGHGFLWSDLACYTVGIAAGCASEYAAGSFLLRPHTSTSKR